MFHKALVDIVERWSKSNRDDEESILHEVVHSDLKLTEILLNTYAAVLYAHSQKGDDRCWRDIPKVYEAAGLPPVDTSVGSKTAMLANCQNFVNNHCTAGSWKSYQELLEENTKLRDCIVRLCVKDTELVNA